MNKQISTAQEALEFISDYADMFLANAENTKCRTKSVEEYTKYDGMRIIINELIDVMPR